MPRLRDVIHALLFQVPNHALARQLLPPPPSQPFPHVCLPTLPHRLLCLLQPAAARGLRGAGSRGGPGHPGKQGRGEQGMEGLVVGVGVGGRAGMATGRGRAHCRHLHLARLAPRRRQLPLVLPAHALTGLTPR